MVLRRFTEKQQEELCGPAKSWLEIPSSDHSYIHLFPYLEDRIGDVVQEVWMANSDDIVQEDGWSCWPNISHIVKSANYRRFWWVKDRHVGPKRFLG